MNKAIIRPWKLHLYLGSIVWQFSNLLTYAKGKKWSYNGESVNVSKIDTFIILKPGILGKNNPSIWAPFFKLFLLFLRVPSLNISSICHWDSPNRKKANNFGEIELKPGTLCCILVRTRLVGSHMTMATKKPIYSSQYWLNILKLSLGSSNAYVYLIIKQNTPFVEFKRNQKNS